MLTWPLLDLVIPSHPRDSSHLRRLLKSIQSQTYPKHRCKVHVITEGNSEEAKALGIAQARGDIIGMLCTDNEFMDTSFLEHMVEAASRPDCIGAYTARYAYVPTDSSLSRYFALLGANDPLCWWLGKADRASYLSRDPPSRGQTSQIGSRTVSHRYPLPSLGDNGCFFKRQVLQLVVHDPKAFGSCMCVCEDLRRLGFSTYAITPNTIWHHTGDSLWVYLAKRWRYTNALYYDCDATRRWHMVTSLRDWTLVVVFALASLLVVPQVLVSLRRYRYLRDWAWGWHPVICFVLTCLYTCALTRHLLWSSARWIVHRSWWHASRASRHNSKGSS